MTSRTTEWWRHAAIYQLYPRSFADGNGDGIGDLAGARDRLDYLKALGVEAIWFSPWYLSPMADAGYDVTDFRQIDPRFGTLADAENLIHEAHERDIRVIVDIVPNHVSNEHEWFLKALGSAPGSPERELFWFRDGRGEDGSLPPNAWQSIFGGPAWTRVPDGQWYLHLFAPEQPDLNWRSPQVRAEYEDILRFWFDRGVDGIRVDSAAMCSKDPALPDYDHTTLPDPHPYVDLDANHEIYRGWRAVADSYPEPRALIGEVWLADSERFARYLRSDELHSAFNFDFLGCGWDAEALRGCIDQTLAAHAGVGAPSTWVLSNHDVTRHVTRYGRPDTSTAAGIRQYNPVVDEDLGRRRARAAALLTMALPGAVYIYQGEELGLPEVEDIPADRRDDPIYHRTAGEDPGRDGCRVPLPWSGGHEPYGFSPDGAERPWLPQPASWAGLSVAAQETDPASMLWLYREALSLRAGHAALGDGPMQWLEAPAGVLAFARGATFTCVLNLSDAPVDLPEHRSVLLGSGPLDGTRLPPDTGVWLRTS
ncbi:glycoside hydrolase family 13 protein [Streptomyces nodosus]|uniref:Alpha-glucosidase n=1 Tax=Streptomyces nodosus TaxID=40318 RepID=A0A0B5DI71_9ACTN|nr:glycoside hydrolase family 13 protein [Streptomyces nodosus]AJE43413.1 alpha-glucosidase [Streptomyces nodosus]MBB4794860.1 alpha-glucosidase [Streptomyces nodosus]QEV41914.1 glycoside hydrolase family 13 protein [Streptomyces nodosus]